MGWLSILSLKLEASTLTFCLGHCFWNLITAQVQPKYSQSCVLPGMVRPGCHLGPEIFHEPSAGRKRKRLLLYRFLTFLIGRNYLLCRSGLCVSQGSPVAASLSTRGQSSARFCDRPCNNVPCCSVTGVLNGTFHTVRELPKVKDLIHFPVPKSRNCARTKGLNQ